MAGPKKVIASVERLTLVNEELHKTLQRVLRFLKRQEQSGPVPALRAKVEKTITSAEHSSNLGHRW